MTRHIGSSHFEQHGLVEVAERHSALIGIGCAHLAAGRYDRAALW